MLGEANTSHPKGSHTISLTDGRALGFAQYGSPSDKTVSHIKAPWGFYFRDSSVGLNIWQAHLCLLAKWREVLAAMVE